MALVPFPKDRSRMSKGSPLGELLGEVSVLDRLDDLRRRLVRIALAVCVGLLAGFLASAVAVGVGWALARFVFDFTWTAAPWVPLAGAVAGAVLALAAGWWGLREVLLRPVVDTLRRSAE